MAAGVDTPQAPETGASVRELTGPFAFDVHRAVETPGALSEFPPWITRSRDQAPAGGGVRAVGGSNAMVVLVGGSGCGRERRRGQGR